MLSRSQPSFLAGLLLAFPMFACAHRPAPEQPTAVIERAGAAPQPVPAVERTADNWIDQYVVGKQLEAAQLRAAGLGADWDFIRQKVVEHLPEQTYPAPTPAGEALLRQAHVDDTTSFIVRIGYRARHLAHPAQARTIVRAANIRSWDNADSLVLVSPTVFVAELVRMDRKPDNSADLVYRVHEPIKNAPAKGSEFRYPIHGPAPTVSLRPGEPPPPPPLPNPAAWELSHRRFVLFFRGAPDAIGNFFSPMPIEGERVLPGYHSDTGETTLARIRSAARAQLCSPGYVPVAEGLSLTSKC